VTPFECELVLRENGDEKLTLHTFLAQVWPGTHYALKAATGTSSRSRKAKSNRSSVGRLTKP